MVHRMTNGEKTRAVSFGAFGLHTDGFYAVDSSQRGSIDRRLETGLWGADLGFAWLAAPGLTVEPAVSLYSEERGNGTVLSENSTEALDFSLRVTSEDGAVSWQALAWHQRREFDAVFSSVNEERTEETMALDQFDVPGRGTGGALTLQWEGSESWSVAAGVDVRCLSGETNEDVGTFRRREAGGDQSFQGMFCALAYQPDEATRFDGSVRLDAWRLTDGRREETSLSNGNSLRSDIIGDRDGVEPSASMQVTREIRRDLEARIAVGSAFRLPTLNELYRPFRVRNDVVEANPELDAERFASIEAGLNWQPGGRVTASAGVFHHWIRDAVANVPVTDPAEIAEIFPTLPKGGTGSQRRNVDEARVAGLEAKIAWRPDDAVTLGLAGLWSHTEFSESAEQPLLEDKPFPQAPDLRLIANGEWRATERFAVFGGVEYGSRQYDDALATRPLPAFASVRIGAMWRVAGAIYQVRVENLLDEEIQTGLSGDGIRTYAGPRSLWVGAGWEF
jgi:hypothetical protein